MIGFDGKPVGELGEGFDLGELLQVVRAAATPEERVSANEAISIVTTRLRSNRPAIPRTAVRGAASKGRRASTRVGAAFVVTVFTASASLAISGQLPTGARDVAAGLLAQIGLFPVPRLEASGQLAAAHTTEEPFGPADAGSDVRLTWMPRPQVNDGNNPPPVVDPTPVDPPPVIDPTPVDPPPVVDPPGDDPPPVVDPPGDDPPPVVDPPGNDPPPVVDPPGNDPPPVVDPPGDDPPPVVDPPGDDPPPVVDPQPVDPPPGHGPPPGQGPPFDTPPGQGPPFDSRPARGRRSTRRPARGRRSTRRPARGRRSTRRPARGRRSTRRPARGRRSTRRPARGRRSTRRPARGRRSTRRRSTRLHSTRRPHSSAAARGSRGMLDLVGGDSGPHHNPVLPPEVGRIEIRFQSPEATRRRMGPSGDISLIARARRCAHAGR